MNQITYIYTTMQKIENKIAKSSGLEKYKIYNLFNQIRELISYREIKAFVDISEDGKSFRCQRCNTLIHCEDSTYDVFEFFPICGQRVAPEGTYLKIYKEGLEDE